MHFISCHCGFPLVFFPMDVMVTIYSQRALSILVFLLVHSYLDVKHPPSSSYPFRLTKCIRFQSISSLFYISFPTVFYLSAISVLGVERLEGVSC